MAVINEFYWYASQENKTEDRIKVLHLVCILFIFLLVIVVFEIKGVSKRIKITCSPNNIMLCILPYINIKTEQIKQGKRISKCILQINLKCVWNRKS